MLMNVYGEEGQFISGLKTSEITLLEDGQSITPDKVEEYEIPLYLTVAVNSGSAMATRDGQGISRYDKVSAELNNWASTRPSDSQDNISLVWNGGIVISHNTPSNWKTRFEAFDPALRTTEPSLAALSFSLDAAMETGDTPGIKPAILLISPHVDNRSVETVSQLASRAIQGGVRVFVWMVDSDAYLEHPGTQALRDLASATGGRFQEFTGTEFLPDLESWFAPTRHIYRLTYESNIIESGQHTLSMQVTYGSLVLTTPTTNFELTVEAPNPILLELPAQITRENPSDAFDLENATPTEQEIQIIVEFPDNYKRPLARTALYVDGELVQENTSEPFNKFTWDLSQYIVSGQHQLQVEVTDTLGLGRTSAANPVTVTVIQPPGGIPGLLMQNSLVLVILALLLTGLVLLFILVLGGRLQFSSIQNAREKRKKLKDPVTQPVHASVEPASPTRSANPFPWLRRKSAPPPAYFVRLANDGTPIPGDPISLFGQEMTFGTDPTQATHVLDDLSIAGLHARVRQDEHGQFILADNNSVAGTWVNFEPITREGCTLKHGDMVNFGKLTYRFVYTKAPVLPKPVITPLS